MARLEVPPPTKEFFIPTTAGTENRTFMNHACYLVDHDNDIASMEFMIPHDFHKLIKAELVWLARAAVNDMLIKGTMCYGGHNESYITHMCSCDIIRTTVMNRIYRDDVSNGLAAAAPLDHVGYAAVRPSNGNANAGILGVRVRYV